MAENPKTGCESGEKMETQKIWVSDLTNGADNSDSFVIDMETFSHAPPNNDTTTHNSRITLQRNLSRKGSQRGGEKKMNSTDLKSIVADTSSPRGATGCVASAGNGVPATVGMDENGSKSQQGHQISINTSNTGMSCGEGGRAVLRRNSSRRWGLDPKRVVMLFASLSSMGTMLMIYLTLSIGRKAAEENGVELEWQQ